MPDETRTIEPALTAEEWRQLFADFADERSRGYEPGSSPSAFYDDIGEDSAGRVANMAMNNAALPDGDPRKITREDVSLLSAVGGGYAGDPYQGMSNAQRARAIQELHTHLLTLAAKLAALLPPEI